MKLNNFIMLNIANLLFKRKKETEKEDEIVKEKAIEKDYAKEIEESIVVYVMPERFLTLHVKKNKAKSTGIIIIASGILLFGAIGFGLYFFLFRTDSATLPPETATTTESGLGANLENKEEAKREEPKEETKKEKTPAESYQEMKADFDKIENFSQFETVSRKYGSRNKIKEMDRYIEEVKAMPEEFKNNIAAFLIQQQMPKLSEIGEIKEEVIGNAATLNLTGKDFNKKGVVVLIKEGGDWKLESESWSGAGEENGNYSENINFIQGTDSDLDGLTDKEELMLGSNSNSSDSDGDGYADLSELENLYNPNGAGKITANQNVANYTSAINKYNLIYPKSWPIMTSNGDSSVIFKSPDNHFIQTIIQPNANKETIESWYSSQFEAAAISDLNKISSAAWQGIKSEDGLTVYLADFENNNIYTITYNIGADNILEYKNIFNTLVKSFSVSE